MPTAYANQNARSIAACGISSACPADSKSAAQIKSLLLPYVPGRFAGVFAGRVASVSTDILFDNEFGIGSLTRAATAGQSRSVASSSGPQVRDR